MSKPLELTIHPPVQCICPPIPPSPWTRPGSKALIAGCRAHMTPHAKRLTEAELAAEFEAARCDAMIQRATGSCWAPLGETWSMKPSAIQDRAQTLLRFATHPHYFEEQE